MRARIPDPNAETTFLSAKLDWERATTPPHDAWLEWYRRVLAIRREEIVPRLPAIRSGGDFSISAGRALAVRWSLTDRNEALVLAVNLSAEPVAGFPGQTGCTLLTVGEHRRRGCLCAMDRPLVD